ncbi:gas vesicle protein [Streptomyces sporangiiformans]|uniref:Gas vesicle protein n=1 Tax=Streptomyces sporangiiformans TaxID=2315329 RepID=A0A505CYW9_9ACTN|nr:gas vesicle protein [Streptomyces sporangiiformans]TPQ15627.1 gas vesicle protein [Streptomyces sporangiiformans]
MTSTDQDAPDTPDGSNTPRTAGNSASPSGRVTAPQAMRGAASQLGELLGTAPESVSALRPAPDGWTADVEVVELERVPDTMTVMATYRVSLDAQGQLLGYERARRYARGQLDRGR